MKPEDAPRLDEWMNATEIAIALGISRQTVSQMIHSGDFKTLHRSGSSKTKPNYMAKTSEVQALKESRSFPRSGHTESA